jgi:hypothetical protein
MFGAAALQDRLRVAERLLEMSLQDRLRVASELPEGYLGEMPR